MSTVAEARDVNITRPSTRRTPHAASRASDSTAFAGVNVSVLGSKMSMAWQAAATHSPAPATTTRPSRSVTAASRQRFTDMAFLAGVT